MVDYNSGDPIGPEINSIMVGSAFTALARIIGEDDEGNAVPYVLLETRIFTVDGTEHHLMWPPEACLPLLGIIGTMMTVLIGGVHPEHTHIPDNPEAIDWDGYGTMQGETPHDD